MRRVVDRLAMPYVEAVVERLRAPGGSSPDAGIPRVFVELPLTLHEARTLALADMPAGAESMLSVGASGSWYLEWIEQNYGHVGRHVAVERFSPMPENLPASVEWLSMDIAEVLSTSSLTQGSLDLIYSGQNIEHL